MTTPYLSRLNSGFTPSQGTYTPATGGGSPYEPPITSTLGTRPRRQGFYDYMAPENNWAAQLPNGQKYYNITPAQYEASKLEQQYRDANYGYDDKGNWTLLNGATGYNPNTTNSVPQARTELSNSGLSSASPTSNGAPLPGTPAPALTRQKGKRSDSQAYGGAAQYNQFQNYNNPLDGGLSNMYQSGTPYAGTNTGVNMDFSKALWR
jgi:hypothetical protein